MAYFNHRLFLISGIGITILLFSYLKQYGFIDFLGSLSTPYTVVGLSYILFRVIHLMVDVYDRSIRERINFITYLNYTCFFLSFVSGPIMRYQQFVTENERSRSLHNFSAKELQLNFSRIINGFIKIIGLATLFYYLHNSFDYPYWKLKVGLDTNVAITWLAFSTSTYFVYLYFNFSGYIDVVLGIGALFGFRLPENFNRPFQARSFLEFWSRWHMTLSEWFKTYFFNPLVKALSQRWSSPKMTPYLGVIGYFATFFVVGYWHVPSLALALFLAFGASINKLYQVWMKRVLGKQKLAKLNELPVYQYLCQGLTFSYMAITLTFLWTTINDLLLYFPIWKLWSVFLGAWIILGIVMGVLMLSWNRAVQKVISIYPSDGYLAEHYYLHHCWLAFKLFILIYIIAKNINPTPAFIYMGF